MLMTLTLAAALLPGSLAADPVPTLELSLVDPGGQQTALTVPLPWEETYTFHTEKRDYELAISAEHGEGDKVSVSGVVSEVKKGKAKAVSSRKVELREGRQGDFRANFMAPKGMEDEAGNPVTALHWSFEGTWMLNGEGEAIPDPPVPEGEHVLVWRDAALHTAPREGAPSFRLGGGQRLVTEAPPVPFRLVGEADGWLELRVPSEAPRAYCHQRPDGFHGLELTVYARPESLAPVTTRVIELSREDGGGFTLNPGVAAQCDASGRCLVVSEGYQTAIQAVLALPEDAVGDRFTPAASLGIAAGIRDLKTRAPQTLLATLGEDPVESAAVAERVQALTGARAPLATVGDDCARYVLPVMPSQVVPVMERAADGEPGASSSVGVREGAPLSWADGSPAGSALMEVSIFTETSEVGGKTCWPLGLEVEGQDPVLLCADPADVE